MPEQSRNTAQPVNNANVIDLVTLTEDYLRCFRRYWLQFFLLLAIVAVLVTGYYTWSYMPSYEASVTYSLKKTEDVTYDAMVVVRLSDAIPTVVKTKDFTEDLFSQITNVSSDDYGYTISSDYTEGTTLFTVAVTTNNYQNSNILLDMFRKVYPDWASKAVGTVELQLVDVLYSDETPINIYSPVSSVARGILAGMAVCIAFATLYVFTITTVRKESDLKKITVKSCISLIPDVRIKKRSASTKSTLLITNKHVDWGLKQSLLAAQSRIEKLMEKDGQKVFLMTSSLPQEGKSMVSVNLALAYAEKGKKVLLLDGDMRNPSVLKFFGLQDHKGLSDYFSSNMVLRDLIVTQSGVDIISGGSIQGAASSLLNEEKMRSLMQYARMAYDCVILDTPPACGFTDADIFSRYADAVVYVVRHDVPTVGEVRDGMDGFIQSKKLLGYLINRNPGGFSTYGKYGKYGKYGSYGYRHYGKYRHYIETEIENEEEEDSRPERKMEYEKLNTEDSL
ncbi:MAG: polysaccharide biosynthesis tyrosine autokinase [Lachnospiraceae bacterium]|nr:polysaccharide biosynthesis tyrosine autokinase [Lachnospiraceae bacterium]